MNGTNQRPSIPCKLSMDESDCDARLISIYLNTAIKRAQQEGPVDDMRLELNQATRAISKIEHGYSDQDKLNAWKEVLQQLEACYAYIKEKYPSRSEDSEGPKSWSNSWSGRDDNGIV